MEWSGLKCYCNLNCGKKIGILLGGITEGISFSFLFSGVGIKGIIGVMQKMKVKEAQGLCMGKKEDEPLNCFVYMIVIDLNLFLKLTQCCFVQQTFGCNRQRLLKICKSLWMVFVRI